MKKKKINQRKGRRKRNGSRVLYIPERETEKQRIA